MDNTFPLLLDQRALVTGGSIRLGRAIALALADAGMDVVVHFHSSELEAAKVVQEISEMGRTAWAVPADFKESAAVEPFFARVVEEAGPIDLLVNNASVFPTDSLPDLEAEALLDTVKVNALGPLALSRVFARQEREGAIINLLDSRMEDYDRENLSYHLSKRMLYTLTRIMALEFAPRLRVNGVAPGLILPPPGVGEEWLAARAKTNPLQDYGLPADITRAVLFLAHSPFITGQVVNVDGGRHLHGSVY